MNTALAIIAIPLFLILLFFVTRRRKGRAPKKYPEYPTIDDEYIDAIKYLPDNKINRRFLP